MRTFRQIRTKTKIAGFHCHHLIPVQIVEKRSFARFFGEVRAAGFEPNDFCSNGMHLPATEELALVFGLPQHSGSHPIYNEMVADQIAQLSLFPTIEAVAALSRLQSNLRLALRLCGQSTITLLRDPMNVPFDTDADYLGLAADLRTRSARLP